MHILEVYLLLVAIFCLWHFGLVPTVRYVFKSYVTARVRDALQKVASDTESKELRDTHKKIVDCILRSNYQEFLIALNMTRDMTIVRRGKPLVDASSKSEVFRNYMENAAKSVPLCLYMCTFRGFTRVLLFAIKRIVSAFFTTQFSHFTRQIAQPATLMLILVSSFNMPSAPADLESLEAAVAADAPALMRER